MKFLTLVLVALVTVSVSAEEGFVEDKAADSDGVAARVGRNLLQANEELNGPDKFFTNNFYLTVKKAIQVVVFDGAQKSKLGTVALEKKAITVKGSFNNANKTEFLVTLDWKTQFQGNKVSLDGMTILLTFKRNKKSYTLTKIEADSVINGKNVRDMEIKARSKSGLEVSAPIKSAFECASVGMFPPNLNKTAVYNIGLIFPNMKLQVFETPEPKFGPSWGCGEMMSIGLWIGILITLFFALICYYGFSMLASIQTMDRFDDPKGKSIHVPQGD